MRTFSQKLHCLDILVQALIECEATIIVSEHVEEPKLETVAHSHSY